MAALPGEYPLAPTLVYPFIFLTMNAKNKKLFAGAAILAVAVPAVGFAATSSGTTSSPFFGMAAKFRELRAGSGSEMGMGRHMRGEGRPMMGGQAGMGAGIGAGILSNEKVREALAASGITLPSAEELAAFHEKMQAARAAEAKLSDAEKTEFSAIRTTGMEKIRAIHEEIAKSERDYLRSKGVALPSEEEIAKMREIGEKARETLGVRDGKGGFGMMNKMRGGEGFEKSGRGGMMGKFHEGRGNFRNGAPANAE